MAEGILVADVGGTKCDLAVSALFQTEAILSQKTRYVCREFSGFPEILATYRRDTGVNAELAVIAVAGVVTADRARITNLPWSLEQNELAQNGISQVLFVNDLTALCAAVPLLEKTDTVCIRPGDPEQLSPIAVIAPGTGLGEGYLIPCADQWHYQGSEGGHTDFAPATTEQIDLLRYMRTRFPAVSYEMVSSGSGIPSLYTFFRDACAMQETPEIRQQLAHADDPTAVICSGALAKRACPLCQKTIELFLSILGAEAGNLALKIYARGGVYLGGGILPRLWGRISFMPFIQAFANKAKMGDLLSGIPVHLIANTDASLIGAAAIGRRHLLK